MTYVLKSQMTVDRSLEEVFDFFADASNLEAITPPELRFRILTPLPIPMFEGQLIEYQMSLYGVPFSWQTEISVWEPGKRFIDQQLRGPYRTWIHEHRFESIDETTTRIQDEVRYSLPLEPLGRIAHPLVRSKLDRIFSYREEQVAKRLVAD